MTKQVVLEPKLGMDNEYKIRTATLEDLNDLKKLIERSVRGLSRDHYQPDVIENSLIKVFGVDTQLIHDETYFAVVTPSDKIVGCGGWSYRKTLFGSDSVRARDAAELDPATEPAKVRAFFVDPEHTRKGLGTLILEHCEMEALERGFKSVELMSTMPGKRFYEVCGFEALERHDYELEKGQHIEFVAMRKDIKRKT